MTPVTFRPKRWRLFALLAGAVAFVVAGVFLLTSMPNLAGIGIGLASISFFGLCGVVAVRQLFDREPRLRIDDRGITDRTLKVGCIEWTDILGAEVRTISGNSFISLRLKNLAKFTSKLNPLHRRLTEANQALGFEALNLNLSALDVDPYMLAELIVKEAELHRDPNADAYRDPR